MHAHIVAQEVLNLVALIHHFLSKQLGREIQVLKGLGGNLHGVGTHTLTCDDLFDANCLSFLQYGKDCLLGRALLESFECRVSWYSLIVRYLCFLDASHLSFEDAVDAIDSVALLVEVLVAVGFVWQLALVVVEESVILAEASPGDLLEDIKLENLRDFVVLLRPTLLMEDAQEVCLRQHCCNGSFGHDVAGRIAQVILHIQKGVLPKRLATD